MTSTDDKNRANNGKTEADKDFMVMDITTIRHGKVTTLNPINTLDRDTDIIHISSHAEEGISAKKERPLWLHRMPWLHKIVNTLETPKFRKKVREITIIAIIGIIVGIIAVMIDSYSYQKSGNTILLERLDRLIRAVELDWGR